MPSRRSTLGPPYPQGTWSLLRDFIPEGVIYLVRTAYGLGDDGLPKAVTKANRRRAREALIEFGIATREELDTLPYAEMMHRGRARLRRRGEVDHVLLAVPPYPTNSMPYRRASAANCSMSGCPAGEALVSAAASSK